VRGCSSGSPKTSQSSVSPKTKPPGGPLPSHPFGRNCPGSIGIRETVKRLQNGRTPHSSTLPSASSSTPLLQTSGGGGPGGTSPQEVSTKTGNGTKSGL